MNLSIDYFTERKYKLKEDKVELKIIEICEDYSRAFKLR